MRVSKGEAMAKGMTSTVFAHSTLRWVSLIGAVLVAVACGGADDKKSSTAGAGKGGKARKTVSQQALASWNDAIALFDKYESKGWNKSACKETANAFETALDDQGGKFAEAVYMMGLSYSRCGRSDDALDKYREALSQNPGLCQAKVALAIEDWKKGNDSKASGVFREAIKQDPQCTEAYLNLAIIQTDKSKSGASEAENNYRRALAVRSDYLPAFNELALFYLKQAKATGNKERLDLAEIVCRQAQLINEKYAPIYNTWGLIKMEREEIILALRFFEKAVQLSPNMFEAHMNFGNVTASFRGYKDAKNAFSKAVELRPKSYEAHIGLGMALRGLKDISGAEKAYNEAISLSEKRPEAYFNLGVLYQDYRSGNVSDLKKAKDYFQDFLKRASGKRRYTGTVKDVTRRCSQDKKSKRRRKRSKCRPGRLQNIDQVIDILKSAG